MKKKPAKPNGEFGDVVDFHSGTSIFSHCELVTGHGPYFQEHWSGDSPFVMDLSHLPGCLTNIVLGNSHSPVRFVLILFYREVISGWYVSTVTLV